MSDIGSNVIRPSFHFKAWQEGYRAGRRGCTGADNPYEGDCREARAWVVGHPCKEGPWQRAPITAMAAGTTPS